MHAAAGCALPFARSMASQTQRRRHSRWVETAEVAAREPKQVIRAILTSSLSSDSSPPTVTLTFAVRRCAFVDEAGKMHGWSNARAFSATQLRTNPNAYFYRHVAPDEEQVQSALLHFNVLL